MQKGTARRQLVLAVAIVAGGVSLLFGVPATFPTIWNSAVRIAAVAVPQVSTAKPSEAKANPRTPRTKLLVADVTINTARTFASLDGSALDADGLSNGTFTVNGNLTIANGGSITCDENGTPASACPIKILVTGNMEIQAGGSVHAENNGPNGGKGGDITITVDGNFTMRGASGGNPAAFLTAENQGGGTAADGGKITIIVGGVTLDTSVDPAVGICGSPTGDILIETDARISSSAAAVARRRHRSVCRPQHHD